MTVKLQALRIPLQFPGTLGTQDIEVRPSEYGDPGSVTIVLPEAARNSGVLQLPRRFFTAEIVGDIADVRE